MTELFEDDFANRVKKFAPIASDVGRVVKYLAVGVANLRDPDPLRDGSPRDGEQGAEHQRKKKRLGFLRQLGREQPGDFFKQRNGVVLSLDNL